MSRKMSDSKKFITCPGSKIHLHFEPQFDGKRVVLRESGQSDIQKSIESYGRYTDLHYMLHRLSVGDTSVLSSRSPVYGDFSGLPTNPVDAINVVHSAESAFAALPLEKRAAYNNDFRAWLAACLSGDLDSGNPSQGDVSPVDNESVKEVAV